RQVRPARTRAAWSRPRSRGPDGADRDLAGAAVFLGVEGDLLTLGQARHAGALERGGVDEHVLAAAIRLDETEAFLAVVELHGAVHHCDDPVSLWLAREHGARALRGPSPDPSMFGEILNVCPARGEAIRLDNPAKARWPVIGVKRGDFQ